MAETGTSKVLVSSARDDVSRNLVRLLKQRGASPEVVRDSSEWSGHSPDLLFLDLERGTAEVRAAREAFGISCEIVALVDNRSFERLLPALAACVGDDLFLPLNREEVGLRWERHSSGRGGTRARRGGLHEDIVLEFASRPDLLQAVISEVVEACERLAFSGPRATLNLRVALGEALANAILYGNRQDPGKRVRIQAELRPGEVVVTVADEGEGFDPSRVADPTLPENRGRSHGRGLFLLRSLADEVRFNEVGNAVTLVLRG
ncbi:MAG: ATP-binding protein [Gemmatimonadota bacterium]